jgi:valyl-tRNA synthetase
MGCSCDFDRQAFTMDAPRAKAVREAFFQLFKDGLIYRGKRLVNWDPVTQTALADDEVEMEEVDGHFYYLRYPLADGTGHVTVATTRPETMLGDTAVAINPKDPRANELKGKKLILPIVNREIPIVEDDYVVMPVQYGGDPNDPKATMATGFLTVTPAHDPNDYDIGLRHSLPRQEGTLAPEPLPDTGEAQTPPTGLSEALRPGATVIVKRRGGGCIPGVVVPYCPLPECVLVRLTDGSQCAVPVSELVR